MTLRSYKKILFISALDAPFIRDDVELLQKHFIVQKQIGHGIFAVLKIILRILSSDIVYCWFASVYAFVGVFFSKFFGLKSIVIVGGVDAAKDKELDYGIWLNPWKAKLVRYVFHNADRILVVDPSLKEEAVRLAEYDGRNIHYVPTGYDVNVWKPVGEKESMVLSVAVVKDERTFKRKGIDLLIEAAKNLPDVSFIVIGTDINLALRKRPPLNIKFLEKLPRRDLLPYYQKAKVYCQPSRREGLPNALCEAMLCGCIPVASEVSGNPTAVGDAGILVPPSNSELLTSAIQQALKMDYSLGLRARARIVSLFPKEKRETEIVRIIEGFK
ncbi:MAG: glycosyltransferase family 4 protein [Ignavibacteriales bacterium]|nr:glycosyltransferase family 4 protein [Ignavibacteriales bacterium]